MISDFQKIAEFAESTVCFVRKDSLVGKILHPLTWPFTKLLLEFRLTGSPEDPKWEYLSVIDRVVEAVK